MSLREYHRKRNFKKTTEPKGRIKKSRKKLSFVIQKHAASHLHYDFRLELNGVLKSWAVPKGPCLDPTVKRLAMHVEDHPMEYGTFEGIIPEGQYGGGTVMLWDKGEWIPESDPTEAYKKGDLTFILKGKKLKGAWKLIHMKRDPKAWLLFKISDKYAKPLNKYDLTAAKSKSVTSKKTMEQIAEKTNKVWTKKGLRKLSTKSKKEVAKKMRFKNKDLQLNDLKITNPDKVLYPEGKITKLDILEYYYNIAKWIMPYITKRILTIVRCPDGYNKECFYQKHIDENLKNLYAIPVREKHKTEDYIYIKEITGLLALVQMGTLEIHPWGSNIKNIEKPDMIIFDLDPAPDVIWKRIVEAAFLIKTELEKLKLKSFVKTTGGKGLHVVIPIKTKYNWAEIKNYTHVFVNYMETLYPDIFISKMTKKHRTGKIFLDYLRNQRGANAIAPYSTRARKNAPIATPIAWNELTANYQDTFYTIKTILERLKNLKKDPWQDFFKTKQSIRLEK